MEDRINDGHMKRLVSISKLNKPLPRDYANLARSNSRDKWAFDMQMELENRRQHDRIRSIPNERKMRQSINTSRQREVESFRFDA